MWTAFSQTEVFTFTRGNMCRVMNVVDGYAVVKALKKAIKLM